MSSDRVIPEKMYILVRRDMSQGQQTVQACHAVAELMSLHSGEP